MKYRLGLLSLKTYELEDLSGNFGSCVVVRTGGSRVCPVGSMFA